MNTLSFFIYFVDIIPRLIGIGGTLIFLAFLMAFVLPPRNVKMFGHGHVHPMMGLGRMRTWAVFILGLVFVTLTPSTTALYSIAASEMGEVVVKSEEAQEVFKALKDRVMDELKVEEKKD